MRESPTARPYFLAWIANTALMQRRDN